MSIRNGDKARSGRQRKEKMQRRERIRKLRKVMMKGQARLTKEPK